MVAVSIAFHGSRNPQRDLDIVEMRVIDQMPYTRIADLVGISQQRVRQIEAKTLATLRRHRVGVAWVTMLHLFGEPGEAEAAERAMGSRTRRISAARARWEARREATTHTPAVCPEQRPTTKYRTSMKVLEGDPIPFDDFVDYANVVDEAARSLGLGCHRVSHRGRTLEVVVEVRA